MIKRAQASGQVADVVRLSASIVYKLLIRHGLTRKQPAAAKDHRRFSYQHAGELFMSAGGRNYQGLACEIDMS